MELRSIANAINLAPPPDEPIISDIQRRVSSTDQDPTQEQGMGC